MSEQKSIRNFFSPTSEPLQVAPRPTTTPPAPKRRKVGRPRKSSVVPPADSVPATAPAFPPAGRISRRISRRISNLPADPPADPPANPPADPSSGPLPVDPPTDPPADPVVPRAHHPGPSTSIRARYSYAQKKKVAHYAGVAAAKHFKIHHKNVQRWLKDELDTIKHPHRAKRCNKKGQGRKLSYSPELDLKLLQWVLEQREEKNMPISRYASFDFDQTSFT